MLVTTGVRAVTGMRYDGTAPEFEVKRGRAEEEGPNTIVSGIIRFRFGNEDGRQNDILWRTI